MNDIPRLVTRGRDDASQEWEEWDEVLALAHLDIVSLLSYHTRAPIQVNLVFEDNSEQQFTLKKD